ncbi:NAD-dependent deacylase [Flammeovirga yaeyamensis]|uniref:NAD-dependent protein deacylase n=1 Tax=Flammeovirga yaeyamensis TaxID=367791 RepID=A0AAX1MY33_9BACT|nr:NAD-dependent deacylase [Flammeovirga yaeyamensis]MBB3696269.1 NAD-dependent deacetylase [Flammeovirga yaeyamensis]NMF34950.1 NAD-dependent deacylase [Flammeovirga yaeyamensis]QWG00225.1 NAD-dependent deacylase [Flammeovirga yaeyamensis]
MKKKKIVVLTGAGISAESGIATFRGSDGLWEGHDIMDVASPEGWAKDRELVLDFYNQRRRNGINAKPNKGHITLAALEKYYDVEIITQNVDHLHELAGSTKVTHLHGKLFESRSTLDPNLIYPVEGTELNLGDKCEKGSQLRPNIVWFGEDVPMMEKAITLTEEADFFIIVGTSLQVYPAAGLLHYVPSHCKLFLVDPNVPKGIDPSKIKVIEASATQGVPELMDYFMKIDHI